METFIVVQHRVVSFVIAVEAHVYLESLQLFTSFLHFFLQLFARRWGRQRCWVIVAVVDNSVFVTKFYWAEVGNFSLVYAVVVAKSVRAWPLHDRTGILSHTKGVFRLCLLRIRLAVSLPLAQRLLARIIVQLLLLFLLLLF